MRFLKKSNTLGSRLALLLIGVLGIVDGVIIVGSLTLVDSDFRADFLFSDFCGWLSGEEL